MGGEESGVSTILRSSDEGDTWNMLGYFGGYLGIVNSVLLRPNGDIFTAVDHGWGVYRSTNNGTNWSRVLPSTATSLVAATNGYLYAGTRENYYGANGPGVYLSTDNGNSWSLLSTGLNNEAVNAMGITASNRLLAGTRGQGMYGTTDLGGTWTRANVGLTNQHVLSLAVGAENHIFCGTIYDRVFVSTDGGGNWIRSSDGLTNTKASTLFAYMNSYVLVGTNNGAIYRSTNEGISWTQIHRDTLGIDVRAIVTNSEGHIFAGTHNQYESTGPIYHSTDNGASWVSPDFVTVGVSTMICVAPSEILAGADFETLYRSTDLGTSWSNTRIAQPINYIASLLAPADSVRLAAVALGNGLYRSTDNGLSWTLSNTGLTNRDVRALVTNSRGNIYVATWGGGVFCSTNSGLNWTPIGQGLTNPYVSSLAIDSSGFLYAGTYGRGVFRSTQATTTDVQEHFGKVPIFFDLSQNYPNPFNPNTTIKFQIPHTSFVTLKVFDLLGREVATLVNEEIKAGSYERVFDGSGLASGVYLYRLQSVGLVQTRKLVLLR